MSGGRQRGGGLWRKNRINQSSAALLNINPRFGADSEWLCDCDRVQTCAISRTA